MEHVEKLEEASFQSSKFSIDQLEDCSLSVQVGLRDLGICVVNEVTKEVISVENYLLKDLKRVNERISVVENVIEEHPFVSAGFWRKILLIYKTHKFTLIPKSLFISGESEFYASVHCKIQKPLDQISYHDHDNLRMVNIFASETPLNSFFKQKYPLASIFQLHQGSCLIEGILDKYGALKQRNLHIYLDNSILHVVGYESGKLLLYNQFPIRNNQEFLKMVFLVFKELRMDQKTTPVYLFGNVEKDSESFTTLRKYVKNVFVGERLTNLKFDINMSELEEHKNVDILSAFLCKKNV